MAWKHVQFKPPSGIPAKGAGWGGPSRGAGNGNARNTLTPEQRAKWWQARSERKAMEERRKVESEREARIAQLTDHLCDLGLNADRQETQVSATVAALNRLDGMPRQKNENLNVELTFEELVKQTAESGKVKDGSKPS